MTRASALTALPSARATESGSTRRSRMLTDTIESHTDPNPRSGRRYALSSARSSGSECMHTRGMLVEARGAEGVAKGVSDVGPVVVEGWRGV